ncbi:MAG TPA: hypothetical protein V6C72_10795 [Chroococcales cyanobacterium]
MYRFALAATASVLFLNFSAPASQARGWAERGPRGQAGGFNHTGPYGTSAGIGGYRYGRGGAGAVSGNFHTPYGGTFRGGAAGIATPNAGAVGGAYKGTTGMGGTYEGAGGAAWRRGVGGVERNGFQGTTANGSTYAGYNNARYNAQTGQGTINGGKTFDNAANGQQYGYTENTQFTRGQGGETTIDTDHKGDYQVDWQKGQKPVIVPIEQ